MLQNQIKTFFSLLSRASFRHNLSCNQCVYRNISDVTAGILVIGDEILTGITDVNTPFLIKQLNAINVKVVKVAILPDDINVISSEAKELSAKCTFVLTSGGIGPTHDDVTYEALAKAYDEELELNKEIFHLLENYFGPESKNHPAIMKYSRIPKSAVVNYVNITLNNKTVKYPLVSVKNIYVFPGVPILLQKSFDHLRSKFMSQHKKIFTKEIFIDIDEFSVTAVLNKAVQQFEGHVKFGSYPSFTDNYYKVRLLLESRANDKIEEASNYLHQSLPNGSLVNIKKNVFSSAQENVYVLGKISPVVASAISVIEAALKKYPLSEICLCFNGGKDCTALLYLLYACVQHLSPSEWSKAHFLYVRSGDSFNEIETFIQNCSEMYKINITVSRGSLKDSISEFLKAHPNIKSMFMGSRRCDPGASELEHFCPTDPDWPIVMRVLPLLDWSYSDVWFFLRELQIPYCTLYDRGYTSLGDKSQTVQNPSLLLNDKKGFQAFKPAYMLRDAEDERKSRL